MFFDKHSDNLKIKYKLRESCQECAPKSAHDGEWYDLSTSEDIRLFENDFAYIDLGICIALPEGYEAILAPRSSTFKKYGILQTNGIGVIDERYCGNNDWWKMPAYSTRNVSIPKGTRIAQFRIQPVQPKAELIEVLEMESEDRGGLGSTGN